MVNHWYIQNKIIYKKGDVYEKEKFFKKIQGAVI